MFLRDKMIKGLTGPGQLEIYQLLDKGIGAGAPSRDTIKGGQSARSKFYKRLQFFVLFNFMKFFLHFLVIWRWLNYVISILSNPINMYIKL